MRLKLVYTIGFVLIGFVFFTVGSYLIEAENKQKRISYQILTIAEKDGERKILARTDIEGLPATDFNINLKTEKFNMKARFLNDLISSDKLKMRVKLETRRFFGYSPLKLPLYEEDKQKSTLSFGFKEKVVLLPFGRNGGKEVLKIEITPKVLFVPKNEKDSQNIKIDFKKEIQTKEISIWASKIPHNFEVEARLLADGKEIARGIADCLFKEEKEIILSANENANPEIKGKTFTANVNVSNYIRGRPRDSVGINYKFHQFGGQNGSNRKTVIDIGAGMNQLGAELVYPLDKKRFLDGKNYELRFRIRLADDK